MPTPPPHIDCFFQIFVTEVTIAVFTTANAVVCHCRLIAAFVMLLFSAVS